MHNVNSSGNPVSRTVPHSTYRHQSEWNMDRALARLMYQVYKSRKEKPVHQDWDPVSIKVPHSTYEHQSALHGQGTGEGHVIHHPRTGEREAKEEQGQEKETKYVCMKDTGTYSTWYLLFSKLPLLSTCMHEHRSLNTKGGCVAILLCR